MFPDNNIDFKNNEDILKTYYNLQNSQSNEDRFVCITVYKKPQTFRSYTIPSNGVFSVKIQENTKTSARLKVTKHYFSILV